MSSTNKQGGYGWGLALIIIGALFLLQNFDMMDVGDFISTFWPLILVIIGVKILYNHRQGANTSVEVIEVQPAGTATDQTGAYFSTSEGRLNISNIFGDIDRVIVSDDFSGGSVNNVFGDIRLDLTGIKMRQNIAKIYVSGVFGDILINTPKDIAISVKSNVTAGDITVRSQKRDGLFVDVIFKDPRFDEAEFKIYINCSMVFGSINVF